MGNSKIFGATKSYTCRVALKGIALNLREVTTDAIFKFPLIVVVDVWKHHSIRQTQEQRLARVKAHHTQPLLPSTLHNEFLACAKNFTVKQVFQ